MTTNAAPSVAPTKAAFYKSKNFGGTATTFDVGYDGNVPSGDNDQYQSLNVGVEAKVLAYQHYGGGGKYREWTGAQPDISDIGGLSKLKVIPNNTQVLSFLFKDTTGGGDGQYSLRVQPRDVGEILIYSNDSDEYKLAGLIPINTTVTTAINVRNEHNGVYIANGAIYFRWDDSAKKVDVVEDSAFPHQLTYESTGKSSFLITLKDNQPDD